jgi:hypothetical protein
MKCSAPDYAYGIKCSCIGCVGIKLGTCIEQNGPTKWKCLECGNADDCGSVEIEAEIENIEDSFNSIKSMYIIDGERFYSQTYIDMMEDLVTDCIDIFCQTHYLVTTILLEMSKLLICGADFLARHNSVSMNELCRIRTLAAITGLRAVKTVECVEASCVLGKLCTTEHPPSHHCTGHVLEACNQLLSGITTTTKSSSSSSSSSSSDTETEENNIKTANSHTLSHSILTSLLLPVRISKYMNLLECVYHPSNCEVSRIRMGLGLV